MSQQSSEIFQSIKDFIEQETVVDWSIIFQDQELFELALESIDTIVDNIALFEKISDEQRLIFLGTLTLHRAQLTYSFGQKELFPIFEEAGNSIITSLRTLIDQYNVMNEAQERFGMYEELDPESLETFSIEELTYLRPVFIIIGTYSLLTLDQIQE